MKRIAISILGERVAPRFDSAEKLMLVTVDNGKIKSRELVLLNDDLYRQY